VYKRAYNQTLSVLPTDTHTRTPHTPHPHAHTDSLHFSRGACACVSLRVCPCHATPASQTPRPVGLPASRAAIHTLVTFIPTHGGGATLNRCSFFSLNGAARCAHLGEGKLSYVASCKSFAEAILECLHTYIHTHMRWVPMSSSMSPSKYFLLWCGVWLSILCMYVLVSSPCAKRVREGCEGSPGCRLIVCFSPGCLSVCLPACACVGVRVICSTLL